MTNHPSDDFGLPQCGPSEALKASFTDILEADRKAMAFEDVRSELDKATAKFGPQRSAHEGYAILKEEVDELWDEIKKNDKVRDVKKMRAEAMQVAAMAIRFMVDVCKPFPIRGFEDKKPLPSMVEVSKPERPATPAFVERRVSPVIERRVKNYKEAGYIGHFRRENVAKTLDCKHDRRKKDTRVERRFKIRRVYNSDMIARQGSSRRSGNDRRKS